MQSIGINPATLTTLKKISQTKMADNYYLAGGTACALHLGHRLSYDLDFFSLTPSDPQLIRNELISQGEIGIIQNDSGTFNGSLDETKVSFFIYPYKLIDELITFEGVMIAGIRDLACMKLEVVSSRGSKRDFIDLFFLAQKYDLNTMLTWFKDKYSNSNISISHVMKSLVYFNDAEADPMPIMHINIEWEQVKTYFISEVPALVNFK